MKASALDGAARAWSRGGLAQLPGCPACGSDSIRRSMSRSDDVALMPDTWHIHHCGGCGSLYLNPRPDADSLPAAYRDYLTHALPEAEEVLTARTWTWAAVRDYLHARFGLETGLPHLKGGRLLLGAFEPWRLKLDRFGRHLTRSRFRTPGRLLDIGCGAGEFLELAGRMGWSASGCDPDPNVVAMCRSRGLEVRLGDLESFSKEAGGFDVVTMNQVIEHVIDPQSLLAGTFGLLRPGGMLWIGLPNPQSIGYRHFGAAWAGLHPPYHLCLPTKDVLRRWLADAGFTGIHFERRGAHAAANWRTSRQIARTLGLSPGHSAGRFARVACDLISVMATRYGEETVAVAWKPSRT